MRQPNWINNGLTSRYEQHVLRKHTCHETPPCPQTPIHVRSNPWSTCNEMDLDALPHIDLLRHWIGGCWTRWSTNRDFRRGSSCQRPPWLKARSLSGSDAVAPPARASHPRSSAMIGPRRELQCPHKFGGRNWPSNITSFCTGLPTHWLPTPRPFTWETSVAEGSAASVSESSLLSLATSAVHISVGHEKLSGRI